MALTMIGGLLALVIFGMPIGFALAVIGLILLLIAGTVPLNIIPVVVTEGANNFPLLAIPLFMVAGELMNACDLSRRLINFASSLIGFVRGGLAHVTVVTSMFFAEISGSAVADAAALGSVIIPEMKKKGYPAGFAAALVSCASTMAILIPPSISMILYGVIAQVNVAKMFMAGIIPGLMVGISLMVLSYIFAVKKGFQVETKFSPKNVWVSFKEAFWALSLPIVILGGILGGIFTPTEAAAAAVVTALFVGMVIYRKLTFKELPHVMLEAAKQTAIVMFIIATSALVGWFLTNEQIPQALAESIMSVTQNKWLILALFNILFLIVGMVLHASAAIIMLVPILMPLVHEVGIDPIHFGIVLTMNLGIGQQTPPVASVLLTTCSVGNVTLMQVLPYLKYFLAAMLLVLALITYIPWLSLVVPDIIGMSN
ncbi:TRAP transporter large permease [Ammoniphilus resinae]|uniref:Tripartite ATP-independent transporter DctM subunit n=1 Tax=Ammoniphilus resinae TaxID=861532 RepID=A0ABS4GUD9_9BACL|nr:TRAP transporter large permease [Ammoniphilus resinae]MBP1933866.1 tripartite ATP-independent transporter DctM subunit [Ammoniphilus resinae]